MSFRVRSSHLSQLLLQLRWQMRVCSESVYCDGRQWVMDVFCAQTEAASMGLTLTGKLGQECITNPRFRLVKEKARYNQEKEYHHDEWHVFLFLHNALWSQPSRRAVSRAESRTFLCSMLHACEVASLIIMMVDACACTGGIITTITLRLSTFFARWRELPKKCQSISQKYQSSV